ncbi:hypothetical protein VM1G_11970 [Cytospora mali]|uniref:Uncharacterized protein n=1 Tax=Cytospora mali TaxID=578113 RepID=A0A194WDQ5_CYTMA|nr:hypothetical protein VM1G_11970 [Valsa mali]
MEFPPQQDILQRLEAMEKSVDTLEREYRPCKCPRHSSDQNPKSVDVHALAIVDLSGTTLHLKVLHSVLQRLAGIRNLGTSHPPGQQNTSAIPKREVKAPERLHLSREVNFCELALDELMHPKPMAHDH